LFRYFLSGHAEQINDHTLVSVVNATDIMMGNGQQQQEIHVRHSSDQQQSQAMQNSHHQPQQQHNHNIQQQQQHIEQKYFPLTINKREGNMDTGSGTAQIVITSSLPPNVASGSSSGSMVEQQIPNTATLTITGIGSNDMGNQHPNDGQHNVGQTPRKKNKSSDKPNQRRRLSANHR